MRTAGEVTFADAHKQHANEGYMPSSFIHINDLSFYLNYLRHRQPLSEVDLSASVVPSLEET